MIHKPIQVFLILLALSSPVLAQETYSVTVNLAANVAKLDIGRQLANQAVCTRFSLAASCSQAQACTASLAATGQPSSGASCTIIEANNLGIRIYPNSQAGREAFVNLEMVKSNFDSFARQKAKLDFAAQQTFCKSATQPQIDAVCSAVGLAAGCSVCDSWR